MAVTMALALLTGAQAQLNQNCTVSVLNRNVQVNPDGTWVLPNVPANIGQVKARATCVQNGVTISGESTFFTVPANGAVNLPTITLGSSNPIPTSLAITPGAPTLSTIGQAIQLQVTGTYPDNSTTDLTAGASGTTYTTSNAAIASISADGLVTAGASGTVVIQAANDGASGIVIVHVVLGGASHGGIPDSWAIANGLDPNNPTMPFEDPDRDGLTNLQEYQLGTDPNKADTDGDGLSDGDEVNKYHTSPLIADTDGDGIPDGIEVQTGSNPLDRNSYDLSRAVSQFTVSPTSFLLTVNAVSPSASQQLTVTGMLIDGKTTIDLTSTTRRTNYSSSNLSVCTFGAPDGRVFAGSDGTCTITITNSGFTATATATVSTFSPTEISTLSIAGAIAVDVASNFAYVAAGTNGLVVVDVTDRAHPVTRATLAGIGDAEAIRVAGSYAFIADANGFLRVVRVLNPAAPALVTSLQIAGRPNALAVHANLAAIAAQAGGVSLVNIVDPTAPNLIATFTTPASALGVEFDTQRGLAAVAMGTGGVQVVDISTPGSPRLRGRLPGGDVRRVLLRFPAVLLADVQRSVTAVDITNPDAPVLSSSIAPSLGGAPVDIAAFNSIAMTADVSFGRAVPVINVSNPLQPNTIIFLTLPSPGYSSSVAMDISFGYLITPDTLRISQYQKISDPFGIPPTIQITSPTIGPLIQGATITLSANATDDVAVASVTFLVNGQPVFTAQNPPYQTIYTLPPAGTTITFGATAADFGNNTGTATPVTVQLIPDPGTTVTGRVLDTNNQPVAGAAVTVLGVSSTAGADGRFSLPGVPTIRGNIVVRATTVVNGVTSVGFSASAAPVVGGITNVGDFVLPLVAPALTSALPRSVLAGTASFTYNITGRNLNGATFSFLPAGNPPVQVLSTTYSPDGNSAVLNLTIPAAVVGRLLLVASNGFGSSDPQLQSGVNTLSVPGSDPNADADGDGLKNGDEITRGTDALLMDTDGDGWPDGMEVTFGSDPLDPNSIPHPTASGWVLSPVMSMLNNANPGGPTAGIKQYVSGLTFSMLNTLNPSTGVAGSNHYVSSLTFSMLNSLNPSTGVAGSNRYVSSPTFSLLNSLNPSTGVAGSNQHVSSPILSILNGISPAPTTPSLRFVNSLVFSISNLAAPQSAGLVSSLFTIGTIAERVARPWLFLNATHGALDTDGDGISDEDEIRLGTNPFDRDTDHDGYPDGLEIALGSDPLDPNSIPNIKPPGFSISPAVFIQNFTLLGMKIVPVRPAELRRQQ